MPMNKIERVGAVIEGRQPDRPPVSFWYHFGPESVAGPAAVEAHVRHAQTYDLDFLKIMADNGYPRTALPQGMVAAARDLDRLSVLSGTEDAFGRQLELIAQLARHFAGRLLMTTTIFNAWATLRQLLTVDTGAHGPPSLVATSDPRDAAMARLLDEAPQALARALEKVADSLANFARQCLAAGANGVYLSVRDDWVDGPGGPGTYDRLVRPGDLRILARGEPGHLQRAARLRQGARLRPLRRLPGARDQLGRPQRRAGDCGGGRLGPAGDLRRAG